MINIFKKIDQIKIDLDSILESKAILNFHLALRLNNELYIYVLCNEENNSVKTFIEKYSSDNVEIKIISEEEYNDDNYYQNIFQEHINIKDSRRRFVHLLDEHNDDKNLDTPCPVITFYSYKGGMGRSTTLASFATALANGAIDYQGGKITPQKVVIIDCDFEAPGFTNYFLNNSGVPYNQNGIVEYLTDIEFDKDIDIQKYMWDVAKDPFAGGGEIWVMPAGNLSTTYDTKDFLKNNLNHYLEGLARLDIASPTYLMNRIKKDVIDKICEKINPDFILIDSRTGFNDIFGITALELSKVMIGFFGNNAQTYSGLHFFTDTLLKHQSTNSIIVNSILPDSGWRDLLADFKSDINEILGEIKENGDEYNLEPFKIRRQSVLEKIGTKQEDKQDFIDLITKREFADYNDLFDKLYDLSIDTQKLVEKKNDKKYEDAIVNETYPRFVSENISDYGSPKMRILSNLQRDLPNLYADQLDEEGKTLDFQKELDENRYFFRKCMEDLFNISRFLIIGNKGTGKSYIYESLKNKDIVNALQRKANKTQYKYHFFHLIEYDNPDFFVDSNEFDSTNKDSNDKYFSRFWKVFIWRSIVKRAEDSNLYHSTLTLFQNCETPTEISRRFNDIIGDDDKIILIEKDLLDLDKFLSSKGSNEYIVAIFDPLDRLIKPDKWKDRIAPLINFWRKRPYSKIFPKIFVRKDLLSTIGNINNFQEIENQAINIEWTKEELFAYFFTLVTSSSHTDFFEIMKRNQFNHSPLIEQIKKQTGRKKQFPLDESFLRLASSTFFGKYADRNGRDVYGESYDWIYKNLQNTDDTISIRPFIDLIKYSVQESLENDRNDDEIPILNPDYFTSGKNRKKAIEGYLKDLMREQGNSDLELIFEFFDDIGKKHDSPNKKFLFLKLNHDKFDMLLKAVIQKYPNRITNDVKGLKEMLEQNGIVKSNSWGYSFALLYKYRLGLK